MDTRRAILSSALLFIGLLAFLTVYVAVTEGIDVLTFISLLVLGMFGFGIVGALRHPPPED
ncbi:MAG: hypothetical protein H0T43_04805 [Solirubrobacterales bacterium]|nr:hypothetical protein [Solirubrobacterales bacterium]